MEVGDAVELQSRGVLVAIGIVFSNSASDMCHFTEVGEERVIIQLEQSIVSDSPLPYPNGGADTVGEAVQGYILWDKKNCKVLKRIDCDVAKGKQIAILVAVHVELNCETGLSCEDMDTGQREVLVELLMYKNRKYWKDKKVLVLATGDGRAELALGRIIVYLDSTVCINGEVVGEENTGIVITSLIQNVDPSLVQAQLPNYTTDQPHLCTWPIRLLKLEENGWILGDLYSAYADAVFAHPNFIISSMAKYLRDCENFDGDMRGDLAFPTDLEHPFLRAFNNKAIFEKTFLTLKKHHAEEFLNPRESTQENNHSTSYLPRSTFNWITQKKLTRIG
ncbi:hypothetical protein R1sor_021738 [Riccia sorocarpa]|uniref:DUF8039 domain-containing protein n=1 Tax=Riccia sorocarpa TaxID=122646 RepID=A0ABD3GHV5_9MARC